MPFDKPRLFSGDGEHCENVLPPHLGSQSGSQSGSDRTIGFDLQHDLSHCDTATDAEMGLSAELQVLAAHLRGEADSLAERYAPATSPASPSVRGRRFARRWVLQSVAVGAAGLALLAWRIDRWQESPPAVPVDTVAQMATPGIVVVPQQPAARPAPPAPALPRNVALAAPAATRHTQGIAEVGIDGPAVERHPPADQVEMLRIQALGFEKVIRKLQAELLARDAAQIESQRQIQSLQEEVLELQKQLDDQRR